MTIIVESLQNLSQEEARLMLNSIMRDFTKVRIQSEEDNAYAKSILLMDGELIDNIINVLIAKMRGEVTDEEKVINLSIKAKDAQLKTYYALGYDDSHIEKTLKKNVSDIKKLNSDFITFIKDKADSKTKNNVKLKDDFIARQNVEKKRLGNLLANSGIVKKHKIKLKDQMVTNQAISDKIDELSKTQGGKESFLGDIFAVVTIATITSKVISYFKKKG